MMSTQAIMPNSITHLLRTGSFNGPIKRIANTKWAKASQSYPYAKKGYCLFVCTIPKYTFSIHAPIMLVEEKQRERKANSLSSGIAVNPLRKRTIIKKMIQWRVCFNLFFIFRKYFVFQSV